MRLIYFYAFIGLLNSFETKNVEMSINLPDKSGYQSSVAGSEKHKYGYELKENRHFHHTNTGKDGVRLGCYGFEVAGKQYLTQYVADSKGYRIVHADQDIITVYPKSGGSKKASIYRDGIDFDDENDDEDEGQIQYFFPKGCKGIDVMIDNSSRLRALKIPVLDQIARLPVTLKPTSTDSYVHSTPPNNYIPPGPLNIYRPEQIIVPPATISTPPQVYLPAKQPSNAYLPPSHQKPSNTFLPPKETATKKPVQKPPSIAYIPQQITQKPPIAAYLPPENISNIYLPPKPSTDHQNNANVGENALLPPYHTNDCCCDDDENSSSAKLIVPVPLKAIAGLPQLYAKLILPLKSLDDESMRKLSKLNLETDKIDVAELIGIILET